MPRVLVMNHFAVPRGEPGGTRHAELVGHLERWQAVIIAGDRNLLTRERMRFPETFRPVWVAPYANNGVARIANWVSYAATATIAALRLGRHDAVYASSPHLLAGLAGWLLARVWRVPFVLEIRDLWPKVLLDMGTLTATSPLYRALDGLARLLYRKADALVVLADGVVDEVAREGVARERICVIPNGADPADFDVDEPRETLRERFGFTDRFVVVYAGAHGPANGLGLVLDAAGQLAGTHPDVEFVLVGDGVDKPALQARAAAEKLTNVRFLDPIAKDEMPKLLAAADAGLHVLADVPLFRYGVSPNKLYDYMAAGRPAITNTPGEVSALVRAADAGIATDPEGIADAVAAVADATPDQRARWATNGRAWMTANRSRRAMAARLEALLDDVSGAT